MKKLPFSIKDIDFQYIFRVDYDYEYDCENHGCDGDYCRCGKIVNAELRDIKIEDILSKLTPNNQSEIDTYIVDRLLRKHKLFDKDAWRINIGGGYYGEEIDSVILEPSWASPFLADLNNLWFLNTIDQKIEALLAVEYHFLLPRLKNRKWSIEKVNKSDIKIANKKHMKELDKEIVEMYKDYSLPRGVAVVDTGGYRLVDGYHRVASAPDSFKIFIGREI